MRAFLAASALLLSSCSQVATDTADRELENELENRVAKLEADLAEQQRISVYRSAFLRPNSQGYVLIRTTGGMPLRIGLGDIEESANGSNVTIQIGNPSSVSLRECSFDVGWGETNQDGSTNKETWHNESRRIADVLPAGDFAQPVLSLADIPPSKLGAVTISEVECLRWLEAD